MNNEQDMILKFKATKEKLDWKGNVIQEVLEKDYVLKNYDPSVFLRSIIQKGDLSNVPKLSEGKGTLEFFNQVFFDGKNDFKEYDELNKYKSIESEPINENGIKFVIYRRSGDQRLFWTMDDANEKRNEK